MSDARLAIIEAAFKQIKTTIRGVQALMIDLENVFGILEQQIKKEVP